MEAVSRAWHNIGRPVSNVAVKLWAAQRLDIAIAITVQTLVPTPTGLGIALSRGLRLWAAARAARGTIKRAEVSDGDDEDGDGTACSSSGKRQEPQRQAGSNDSRQRRRQRQQFKEAKGLPPLPLPAIPPGALTSCSTQPLGLPMMLVGQSAARAPMRTIPGNRLVRGLAGLAATFLLCRTFRTPFTGRRARLPPRLIEFVFHKVVGPAAAVSYLTTTAATGQGAGQDCQICRQYEPTLQQLYSQMRQAGEAEARRGGRPVVFATKGASVEAIQRADINACCLPGGIVFVNSGLIKALHGGHDGLAFVTGHEVGHAVGRHSLEKATTLYTGMFLTDVVMGLAERLMQGGGASSGGNLGAAEAEGAHDHMAARLKALEGALQAGQYFLQMKQSREHEYEADELALLMGAGAGMNSRSLFSGAVDVLRKFMRMEAGAAAAGGLGAPQGDNPLSTHPAAVNRLQRLSEKYQGTPLHI